VHESERAAAQPLGPLLGDADATGIRRDHGDVAELAGEAVADVVDQHGHGDEMIHRAVEEALRLRGMQIHAHDAVGAGGSKQVEDQTTRDGLAAKMLLVLARIAQQRAYCSDGAGGGALERVDHDELLHNRLVDLTGVALQHENVRATHRFGVAHVHLAVGEVVCRGFQDVDAKLAGDIGSQLGMRPAGNEYEVLIGLACEDGAHRISKRCSLKWT
jgi:hypothetical protein